MQRWNQNTNGFSLQVGHIQKSNTNPVLNPIKIQKNNLVNPTTNPFQTYVSKS